MWPLLLVLAILLVVLFWFARSRGLIGRPPSTASATATPAPTAEEPTKMPKIQVHIIVWYLLILGLALVFLEVALLSLDFPDTPQIPLTPEPATTSETRQTGQPPSGGQAAPGATDPNAQNSPTPIPEPVIEYVMPESIAPGRTNKWVTVYGRNFTDTSKIRLNGKAVPMSKLSPNLLGAQLVAAEVGSTGTLAVDVVDGDRVSNSMILRVQKPKVPLNVLFLRAVWGEPWINREVQLLLIITLAGALGTFVHILKSATAFIGNGTMKASWFWWYITGPLVGSAMALIFYAVLRGGFLVGTPADEKFVNPFGAFVIGALVGMFSDKASLKLAEIFDTVFRSGDPRGGKLQAPVITSLNPNKVQAGSTTDQLIRIVGERLGKVTVIRFNSTEEPASVISDSEVQFTLRPAHVATAKTLQIVAIDPENGSSVSAPLAIVGPAISGPETLPEATQNTAYDQTFTVVDAAQPVQWSIGSGTLPAGLTLDAATGHLTGTPAAAGASQFTVKVVDANNQSAEKSYDLVVT